MLFRRKHSAAFTERPYLRICGKNTDMRIEFLPCWFVLYCLLAFTEHAHFSMRISACVFFTLGKE